MKKPYISVIITAYNRKEFIKDAVQSVLGQTLNKDLYEIIIIKNFRMSSDKTWINKNIKLIYLKDGSFGDFLRLGIKNAKGKIIVPLDDDDIFFNNKLSVLYNFFKIHNNVIYYHNNAIPINKNGITISEKIPKYKNYIKIDCKSKSALYKFMLNKYYFNMSCVAVKRKILIKYLKYFNDVISSVDDFIGFISLASKGTLVCSPQVLTKYRVHNKNASIRVNFNVYSKKHLDDNKMVRMFKHILIRSKCNIALEALNSKYLRDELNYFIIIKKRIKIGYLTEYIRNYTIPLILYCQKIDLFLLLILFSYINPKKAMKILLKRQGIR